jgi:hypothetical protein
MTDSKRNYESKMNIDNPESEKILRKYVPSYENLIKNGCSDIAAYLTLTYENCYQEKSAKTKALAKQYCTKAVEECLKKNINDFDNKYCDDFKSMKGVAYMADLLGVCKDNILDLYKKSYSVDDSDIVMIREFAKLYIEGKYSAPDFESALDLYIKNNNIRVEDKIKDLCNMIKTSTQKEMCIRKLVEYDVSNVDIIKSNNINITKKNIELKKSLKENERLHTVISNIELSNNNIIKENKYLSHELSKHISLNEELTTKLSETNIELNYRCSELQKKISSDIISDELNTKLIDVSKQMDELKEQLEIKNLVCVSLSNDNKVLKEKIEKKNIVIDSLHRDISSTESEHESAIEGINKTVSNLLSTIENNEKMKIEFKELQRKFDENAEELNALCNEKKSFSKSLNEVLEMHNKLTNEFKESKTMYDSETNRLRTEITDNENKLMFDEVYVNKLENLTADLQKDHEVQDTKLNDEIYNLQKCIQDKERIISEYEKKLANSELQLFIMKEEYEEKLNVNSHLINKQKRDNLIFVDKFINNSGIITEIINEYKDTTNTPIIEQVVELITEQVVQPIIEQVVESITEQVVQPITEQVIEPITEQVVQPITEQVVEPITQVINDSKEIVDKSITEEIITGETVNNVTTIKETNEIDDYEVIECDE